MNFFLFLQTRLNNFTFAVGNVFPSCDAFDPENFTQCVHFPGQFGASETRGLPCDKPVRGRFITVYFKRPDVLTLCEVEVHGLPITGSSFFHHKILFVRKEIISNIPHYKVNISANHVFSSFIFGVPDKFCEKCYLS